MRLPSRRTYFVRLRVCRGSARPVGQRSSYPRGVSRPPAAVYLERNELKPCQAASAPERTKGGGSECSPSTPTFFRVTSHVAHCASAWLLTSSRIALIPL